MFPQVKTPRSRERLQRQITATDSADARRCLRLRRALAKSAQAIDHLVYELYEPTDEEIGIVEEATEQD